MGLFAGIKNATFREGGNYAEKNCYYKVELLKLTVGQMRPPKRANFLVGDFKVLETNATTHKVGDTINYFTADDKDGFLGNVKALAVAVYGSLEKKVCDPTTIDEAEIDLLLGGPMDAAGQPVVGGIPGMAARGTIIVLRTVGTTTKAGTPYTIHNWSPDL